MTRRSAGTAAVERPRASGSPPLPSQRALLTLVALAAVVPYLALPANPLIIDAGQAITDNPALAGGPAAIFTSDFWGVPAGQPFGTNSYRPLVTLTYWMQVQVTGAAPWAFRLVDMALHAGCALLAFAVFRALLSSPRWAAAGALLFAVHPVASESVVSAVGRADLMAVGALLAALALHLRARGAPSLAAGAGTAALIGASLLCKEYAVTFPFVLVATDLALHRAGTLERGALPRRLAVAGGAFAALALYLATRVALFGEVGGVPMVSAIDHPLAEASLAERWGTAAWLTLFSLRLLLVPWPLNYFYSFNSVEIAPSALAPYALAGVAAVVALLAFGALRLQRRRDPVPLIAVLLLLAPLAPSLNTVSLAGVLFAERFLYLPCAALGLAAAWAAETWLRASGARRAAEAAWIGVLVVFAALTAWRVREWNSPERLVRSSLRHYPDSPLAHNELGLALGLQGRHEEAARAFRRSVELRPQRPQPWRSLGIALGHLGQYREAADAWRRCVELSPPDVGPLWRGLGMAELQAGRPEEAADALARAHALMPQDTAVATELARTLLVVGGRRLAEGNASEAARRADEALAVTELPPEGLYQAALLLHRAGATERAAPLFERALEGDPELLRKMHALALEFDEKGDHAQAAELFRQILAARPDHVATLFNLGNTLLKADRPAEAIGYFEAGLELAPDPRARALLEEARRRLRLRGD